MKGMIQTGIGWLGHLLCFGEPVYQAGRRTEPEGFAKASVRSTSQKRAIESLSQL
jgi:hypothetical protein